MLALKINRAPEWVDLVPGVRVLAAPLTSVVMVAARSDIAHLADGLEPVPDQLRSLGDQLAGRSGIELLQVDFLPTNRFPGSKRFPRRRVIKPNGMTSP